MRKSELAGQRNAREDSLLERLYLVVPKDVKVTVLADHGFGDAEFYLLHAGLGFDHVIRFRGNIFVTDAKGESRPAKDWLFPDGRARILRDVKVTNTKKPVAAVACVWAKGMKEPWFLACGEGSRGKSASQLVKLYGRRFTAPQPARTSAQASQLGSSARLPRRPDDAHRPADPSTADNDTLARWRP